VTETTAAEFARLIAFLGRIPSIGTQKKIGTGYFANGNGWTKFTIDTAHTLAWSTVQELGFVLNYVSLDERLPTVFMPVSPPPYLNGGPELLSWVIESTAGNFTPDQATEWLEARLPTPVDDPAQWPVNQ
jgi:hypothetical protein